MPQFSRITYIYALVDPTDGVIRYVGKSDYPAVRMGQHLSPNELERDTPANVWLRDLIARGLCPVLKPLQAVPEEVWQSAECWWMGKYATVLNVQIGGGGRRRSRDTAHQPGAVIYVCEECGARFSVAYYRASGVPKFCGQECYHAMRKRTGYPAPILARSLQEAFWDKVLKTPTCWLWTGNRNGGGYGQLCYKGEPQSAHRFSYKLLIGPIPDGLDLDHLCRNRACVRPDHLEPVTKLENQRRGESMVAINRRKTHCIRGHEFNEANTHNTVSGGRNCRACSRIYHRAYKARKRAENGHG